MPDTSPGRVHGAQLNALSLDIPGEDGKGPPIYDLQTDFPWAFAPAAPGAEMLERVLRVHGPRFSVGGAGHCSLPHARGCGMSKGLSGRMQQDCGCLVLTF